METDLGAAELALDEAEVHIVVSERLQCTELAQVVLDGACGRVIERAFLGGADDVSVRPT